MSWLLRHGAAEVGLVLRADGYAPLATVCTLLTTRGGAVSLATAREVVATNAKKRFDVVWDAPPAGFVWPPPADEAAGGAGAVDVAAGADVFREGRIEWIRANQVRGGEVHRYVLRVRARHGATSTITAPFASRQGHSHDVAAMLDDAALLTPIRDAAEAPVAVHGTTRAAWESIR
jgi:RNA:NAD 2'-phosphotransferase (TPT1/KptA family)